MSTLRHAADGHCAQVLAPDPARDPPAAEEKGGSSGFNKKKVQDVHDTEAEAASGRIAATPWASN